MISVYFHDSSNTFFVFLISFLSFVTHCSSFICSLFQVRGLIFSSFSIVLIRCCSSSSLVVRSASRVLIMELKFCWRIIFCTFVVERSRSWCSKTLVNSDFLSSWDVIWERSRIGTGPRTFSVFEFAGDWILISNPFSCSLLF